MTLPAAGRTPAAGSLNQVEKSHMSRREDRKRVPATSDYVITAYEYTPEAARIPVAVADEADSNPVPMPVVSGSVQLPPIPTLAGSDDAFRQRPGNTGRPDKTGEPDAGTFRVPRVTEYPAQATGKVVVRFGQSAGHGSGSWIAPGVILTAAHVIEGNPTSISFVPSDDGRPSGGTVAAFPVFRSFVSRHYAPTPQNRNYAHDVAVLLVSPVYSDVGEFYGWFGWDASRSTRDRLVTSYGYPADPPTRHGFDGRTLWAARGALRATTSVGLLSMPCEMTRGCSGGPWIAPVPTVGPGEVVSLNSHVRSFDEGVMYGPDLALSLPRMMAAVSEWVDAHNATRSENATDYGRWLTGRVASSNTAAA